MARSDAHKRRNDLFRTAAPSLAAARETITSTPQVISETCELLGIEIEVEEISGGQGANIFWLGSRAHQTVLLYCHGLYNIPCWKTP
jgi:hypothetical protein